MKISDFSIAKFLLQRTCFLKGCHFVDLLVDCKEDCIGLIDGKVYVGKWKSWRETVFNIIYVYLTNFKAICGKDCFEDEQHKKFVVGSVQDFLIRLCVDPNVLDETKYDDTLVMRLYQFPTVWLLMKDIICPAYQLKTDNTLICVSSLEGADISGYVEFLDDNEQEPFIYLNSSIEYEPIRDAYLFYSAIASSLKYCFSPVKADDFTRDVIVRGMMKSFLKDKIRGLLSLSYDDDSQVEDFFAMLDIFVGGDGIEDMILKIKKAQSLNTIKVAQREQGMGGDRGIGSFWFFGLMENMLEPSRGDDWTTYKALNPYREELEKRIEAEEEKVGPAGLSYEALLRIKSGEMKQKDIILIERNLASDRIW